MTRRDLFQDFLWRNCVPIGALSVMTLALVLALVIS